MGVGKAGLAAAVGLGLLAAAAAAVDGDAELAALQRAIAASRERIQAYQREQRGLLEAVEAVDRVAQLQLRALERAQRDAARARAELAQIEVELAALAARGERLRAAARKRATALYRAGQLGAVEILFTSSTLREVLDRTWLLQSLLERDRDLLARYRAQRSTRLPLRERARELAARRDRAVARAERRARGVAAEREAKRRLLHSLRGHRGRERSALRELEAVARGLETVIDRLDRGAAAPVTTPFASRRGLLLRPVAAPIARPFGQRSDAELHTQLFHKGVDFEVPRGTAVRAVAAGRVRFAGWFRGYGRLVLIDHGGDFFTVSSHLDRIEVEAGREVAAGQTIGTAGESGSLLGPRLYFELRRGAEALDPAPWFSAGPTPATDAPAGDRNPAPG